MVHVSSPRLNRVHLTDSKSEAPLNRVRLHKWLLHLHPKSSSCPKSDFCRYPKTAIRLSAPKSKICPQPKTASSHFTRKSEIRPQPKIAVVSPHPRTEFRRQPKTASSLRKPNFAVNPISPSSPRPEIRVDLPARLIFVVIIVVFAVFVHDRRDRAPQAKRKDGGCGGNPPLLCCPGR